MVEYLGESISFECIFSGSPTPYIEWFRDDIPIIVDDRVRKFDNDTILYIQSIKEEDQGFYKCNGSNYLSFDFAIGNLKILNLSKDKDINNYSFVNINYIIITTFIIFAIVIFIIIFLCIRIKRLKKYNASVKKNLLAGCVEQLNSILPLDEQANLLPYDQKYEFPIERLKLGTKLGEGAFGIVLKGMAKNIELNECETTVAVKTIKQNCDNEMFHALIIELKIMIHMGKHLNVVNLLGAITKKINNGELMLIVEYCRFGNLHNYLLKHREYFYNQINEENGILDYKSSKLNEHILNRESETESSMSYISTSKFESMNSDGININSSSTDYEMKIFKKYDKAKFLTTSDLINWSYQVACGMEYLTSRNVLHGDLAARNILLCDNNIVKICDFGLARSMYKYDIYKKKGKNLLPFKWMAIESLSELVFSQYSDVWSFGILLWELFSLAKVPYPGMIGHLLHEKLREGYRMEKPEYANDEIYNLMLNCWKEKPNDRPAFTEIKIKFGNMLEDGIMNNLKELNIPNLERNNKMFTNGKTDYLAMIGKQEYTEKKSNGDIVYKETCVPRSPKPNRISRIVITFRKFKGVFNNN